MRLAVKCQSFPPKPESSFKASDRKGVKLCAAAQVSGAASGSLGRGKLPGALDADSDAGTPVAGREASAPDLAAAQPLGHLKKSLSKGRQ